MGEKDGQINMLMTKSIPLVFDLTFESMKRYKPTVDSFLLSSKRRKINDDEKTPLTKTILKYCLFDFFSGATSDVKLAYKITPNHLLPIYDLYNVTLLPTKNINTVTSLADSYGFSEDLPKLYDHASMLTIQFFSIDYDNSGAGHQTVMVFDQRDRVAYYFDSNGPSASTTPQFLRQRLTENCNEVGYTFMSVQACPQFYTRDSGCAAWSTLYTLIAIQQFIHGKSCNLSTADFYICNTLQETLQSFMVYCVSQLMGENMIYKHQRDAFNEFKTNLLVYDDMVMPDDDVLEQIFVESDGHIDRCMDHFLEQTV